MLKEGCSVVEKNWNQFKNKLMVKNKNAFWLVCFIIIIIITIILTKHSFL